MNKYVYVPRKIADYFYISGYPTTMFINKHTFTEIYEDINPLGKITI